MHYMLWFQKNMTLGLNLWFSDKPAKSWHYKSKGQNQPGSLNSEFAKFPKQME